MLITGIKSRPVYDVLAPMSNGALHVIAGQGSGGQALLRLLGELSDKSEHISAELQAIETENLRLFKSNAELVGYLETYLSTAKTGLRLYLAGSESFIGTAMQVANKFNLNSDEVLREHGGTYVRRVWCVHCDTYTENVTHRVFKCPGCGLDLVVRDHYSGRLAAFMGVKADAEQTGNMPAAEELDT
jgi:dimethylamine monooxygenase subunit C